MGAKVTRPPALPELREKLDSIPSSSCVTACLDRRKKFQGISSQLSITADRTRDDTRVCPLP